MACSEFQRCAHRISNCGLPFGFHGLAKAPTTHNSLQRRKGEISVTFNYAFDSIL